MESKKPKRAEKAPHKGEDYDGWLVWWKAEISERLTNGQTLGQIQEELGVNPKRFIE